MFNFIKNLHENIIAIIVALILILGSLVIFFLRRHFSQKDIKKTLRNKFRATLVETKRLLKQNPTTNCWNDKTSAHHILESHIDNHERAFVRLPKSERIGLQSIWNKYKNDYDAGKFRSGNIENERIKRKAALEKINSLLAFFQ